MKKAVLLLFLLVTTFLRSQILIDTIPETGPYFQINTAPATEGKPMNIYTAHVDDQTGKHILLRYDENLSIVDTLSGADVGRPGGIFELPFYINNNLYYYCYDSIIAGRHFSFHKIQNGTFTDSIGLDLDTISNAYPAKITALDNNTLQILLSIYLPNGFFKGTRILLLDSNFNFKSCYHPLLDSIPPTTFSKQIRAIHQLNDSTWHLFYTNHLVVYNPRSDSILSVKEFLGKIYNTYKLPNQIYLALGLTSTRVTSTQLPGNSARSLGFYFIDSQANILDTVRFNAFKDTVPQWGINNYSTESTGSIYTQNSLVYDTNTIFLVSEGDYNLPNSMNFLRYFYIVKTDIKGHLKWQYIWGGVNNLIIITNVAATSDSGCVVTGSIQRFLYRSAVLIKFGPDGNISNVEVDAPENLVQFFPNPVGDKLKYTYLPEANSKYTLEIIDMNGRAVLKSLLNQNKGSIPIDLKTGFYLYQLKDSKGQVQQVGKLIAK